MDRCLLDTTTLSDVIRPPARRLPQVDGHLTAYLRSHTRVTISDASFYEVMRGLRKKQAAVQERLFLQFCSRSDLLPVTHEVLDHAATIWAQGQRMGVVVEDADLIIASMALLHDFSLVTSNGKHFSWIAGLRLQDWRT